MENHYDAIVIGSGIGGLTTAVLLSKIYKQKVLVLEQHFEIGGQTHEFMRVKDGKKYHWDVGVHYIGDMKKGLLTRKIFDFITDRKMEWEKMADPHDIFIYPDIKFPQPSNPKSFQRDLINTFPAEEISIKQYFRDLKKASGWFQSFIMSKLIPIKFIGELMKYKNKSLALSTTKEYLDSRFKDQRLKAILCSIWGDYGVPPSESAFVIHSIVVRSYLYGAYYPVGGASSIAKNMVPAIERSGGKVLGRKKVNRIIIENNRAVGVEVNTKDSSEQYFAERIISDAGAYNTFINLLPENIKLQFRGDLKTDKLGISSNTLYVGLKESPEKFGIKGENMWIFTGYDHDKMYENSKNSDDIQLAFISFPSLKNPLAKSHTMEIISFTQYNKFSKWSDTKWLKRGSDYEAYKNDLSLKLLNFAEKHIPGIKDIIDYHELSTPLSMKHFTGWEKGSFYSYPATPDRFNNKAFSAKTPVKNLYLTGTDAGMLGVLGAMMGALFSTVKMKGLRSFMKIMKKVNE
ncbi:MAG: NAD(P)/FAD-dependent oxidoreductase [Saprospiraceae bacterium]|nr:NAD(P)/FAD-dependent oxidoreductase [Saprospiraceae bacterium]